MSRDQWSWRLCAAGWRGCHQPVFPWLSLPIKTQIRSAGDHALPADVRVVERSIPIGQVAAADIMGKWAASRLLPAMGPGDSRPSRLIFTSMSLLLLLAVSLAGQPMAFTNAHIIPVEGPEIRRGTLLVDDGKILPWVMLRFPRCIGSGLCEPSHHARTYLHPQPHRGLGRCRPVGPHQRARIIDALNPRSSGWKQPWPAG